MRRVIVTVGPVLLVCAVCTPTVFTKYGWETTVRSFAATLLVLALGLLSVLFVTAPLISSLAGPSADRATVEPIGCAHPGGADEDLSARDGRLHPLSD